MLHGMALGMTGALAVVGLGVWLNPFGYAHTLSLPTRLGVAARAIALPAACLMLAIGRLAAHRFRTPGDIDGSGLTQGSERANLLQALLQNTLEQTVLASAAYVAWAVAAPASWLSVVPLAALTFVGGRLLFFARYRHGAGARAFGFALTFYPTALMLLTSLLTMIWNLVA
ncbi:MAPEG family protein [Oleiagrimonas soli]|uniref:MAPEG family protein n=1 Tax=Oleiagrimonas soli TaxID=1543381 RepID=A0A841KIC0_9GAMM|nr:MAPEG family protein [Oleiagrimonas soli]MBB6185373.1 hypothetical protein [Oleiagrimonas soli]